MTSQSWLWRALTTVLRTPRFVHGTRAVPAHMAGRHAPTLARGDGPGAGELRAVRADVPRRNGCRLSRSRSDLRQPDGYRVSAAAPDPARDSPCARRDRHRRARYAAGHVG